MTPDASAEPVRICFVCLGNICRSPTAEAVMRHQVDARGLQGRVVVDSAGTADYHVGDDPDHRAVAEATRRGIALEHLGRQFSAADFDRFDLVLAMDTANERELRRRAPTPEAEAKVHRLRQWDPEADGDLDVPDPYYGSGDGFVRVYEMVERSCAALLDELAARWRSA